MFDIEDKGLNSQALRDVVEYYIGNKEKIEMALMNSFKVNEVNTDTPGIKTNTFRVHTPFTTSDGDCIPIELYFDGDKIEMSDNGFIYIHEFDFRRRTRVSYEDYEKIVDCYHYNGHGVYYEEGNVCKTTNIEHFAIDFFEFVQILIEIAKEEI